VADELEEQEGLYLSEVGKLLETARRRLGVSGRGRELAQGDQTLLDKLGGDDVAEELAGEWPGLLGADPYQRMYELLVDPPRCRGREHWLREAERYGDPPIEAVQSQGGLPF
jgi:hypothetical protein